MTLEPVPPMEYTGERMVPEACEADTFWEHVYRYRFAARYAKGKRVLDVACGEGYGAHALERAGARSVIGVDISEEACAHARRKYGLDARSGDAAHLPLDDGCVDLVTSFETIEHVPDPAVFLGEIDRVLAPDGVLVLSTPNRDVYGAKGEPNPFHCSELTLDEFVGLLAPRFPRYALYTQVPKTAAWWSIRALAARESPWREVKGYWRLRKLLSPGHGWESVPAADREDPDRVVLGSRPAFFELLNPFAIRPYRPALSEQPYYFLAVARRR